MGEYVNSRAYNVTAWATTVIMTVLSIAWFWTLRGGTVRVGGWEDNPLRDQNKPPGKQQTLGYFFASECATIPCGGGVMRASNCPDCRVSSASARGFGGCAGPSFPRLHCFARLRLPPAVAPLPKAAKTYHDGSLRDIDAIGNRKVGCDRGLGNWYSLEKQIEMGHGYAHR